MSTTIRDYLHKKQSQSGTRLSIASSVLQSETPVPTLANQEHRDSMVSSYSQSEVRYVHQEKGWAGDLASEHMRPHTPFDDDHDV
jgi:hypothetical protein